jgi:hypothetical protein
VLEACDTLFNKRDYVAAEPFWSERYFQHGARIPPRLSGDTIFINGRGCAYS